MEAYDAVVAGGGAAGLSAALILGRSRRRVLVCDDGKPRNAPAAAVHGLLSREGIEPKELLRISREQLDRYPNVTLRDAHVASAREDGGGFLVEDRRNESFRGSTLLIATGVYDELPKIEGLERFWGSAAFVCPYCDAWEFRGKRIVAIGTGERANDLAEELRQWSDRVETVDASSVARIEGSHCPELRMHDGSRAEYDAVFLSAPLRQRSPLADALGVRVRDDGGIEVDECGRTSVRGCYAAGDAATEVHQLAFACASGVRAAMAINEDLLG